MTEILFAVVLPLALAFIMFALGLGLTVGDFANVVRRPRAFAVGAFAQLFLIPLFAYAIVIAFGVAPQLALGVMIISLCPGGPTTNMLTRIARGDLALSVSLTGVISLTSAFTVPVMTAFFAWHFLGVDAPDIDITRLSVTMFAITVVPLLIGMAVRRTHAGADRLERIAVMVAGVLFVAIIVFAIAANWTTLVESLAMLAPALITLIVALLAAGLLSARLAGLDRPRATAIAIDTGIQNGTLGITVGNLMLIGDLASPYALPSAVYGVLMYAIAVPFALWRRRSAVAA